jgi:hypothetical protein
MVTLRKGSLGLALVCGLVGTALAGPVQSGPVQVFGNWARGDMGVARTTPGSHSIGCWANSDARGPALVYCEAIDGAGNFNFCYTQNPNLASVLAGIDASSEIEFGWGADHACAWLTVGNYSRRP